MVERHDAQLSLLELLERPTLEALLSPDELYGCNDPTLLASLPEDNRLERKGSRVDPRALAVCLSAFGNGSSVFRGVVIVGIEDNGQISGCKSFSGSRLQEIESCGMQNCPSGRFSFKRIRCKNCKNEDDFLIAFRIDYVEDKLIELQNGEAYQRLSGRNRKLTDYEKQEIRISKGERAFELEACSLIYPDEFNVRNIKTFAQMIRELRDSQEEISDEQLLEIMHLGKRTQSGFVPNNACCLLFANDPQTVFPGSYIRFLRYAGISEGSGKDYNVIKDRLISGTVLDQIKQASSVMDANLRELTKFQNGKFFTIPEYPRDAWYELLVNACVHRSYNIRNAPIFVKMFDDRLVIESPGGFMPYVTPDNIFEMHRPRNPFLMLVLREFGEVRCINEGTKRVRKELIEANLPAPEFYQETSSGTAVRVTIRNDIANRSNALDNEAYKIIGENEAKLLDHEERKIINFVVENGEINVSDALRILSTTYWHTAKKRLMRLVSRGILIYDSSKVRDPKARYKLKVSTKDPSRNGN